MFGPIISILLSNETPVSSSCRAVVLVLFAAGVRTAEQTSGRGPANNDKQPAYINPSCPKKL